MRLTIKSVSFIVIFMITKEKARTLLLIGYIISAIGFVIGFYTDPYKNLPLSCLFLGYLFWSIYWGCNITYNPISSFFSRMIIFEDSLIKLFFAFILKRLIIYGIILFAGLFVGVFGGAIGLAPY